MIAYTETEKSLLKAIVAEPDNDVPRCMLADELKTESFGPDQTARETLGEFIRVQVELARTPPCPACGGLPYLGGLPHECRQCHDLFEANRLRLLVTAECLLYTNGHKWCPASGCVLVAEDACGDMQQSPAPSPLARRLVFRRGFPDEVRHVRVADWVTPSVPRGRRSAEIRFGVGALTLDAHPTVTRVVVADQLLRASTGAWYWPHATLEPLGYPFHLQSHWAVKAEALRAMSAHLINLARS